MGKLTGIEYVDSTLNLAWGCTQVSDGCKKCFMFRNSKIYGYVPTEIRYFSIDNAIRRLRTYGKVIFFNDNTDTFHENIPDTVRDMWFKRILANPEFADKQFLVLTKRAGNMYRYFKTRKVPDNIWLGVSVEDQWHVFRIKTLQKVAAMIRWVSFEPLLKLIKNVDLSGIAWAVVGGESDFTNPRLPQIEWIRSLRDECKAQGLKFFYKQFGGTKKCHCHNAWGCRLLDGRTWDELLIPIVKTTN